MLANTLLNTCTLLALDQFKQNQSILCLDINFRPAFWQAPETAADTISVAACKADIIKASREELILLYGIENIEKMTQFWIEQGVSLVLVTDGGNPVSFSTQGFADYLPCAKSQAN